MASQEQVYQYLYYGFTIEQNWISEKQIFNNISETDLTGLTKGNLINNGVKNIRSIFEKSISETINIVPLSGGMDSRAILGGLLENCSAKNIITVTFGTPGTLDYELGKFIAKKSKLINHSIDLTKVKINQDLLLKTITEHGAVWTGPFESYYNKLIYNYFKGKDVCYWNGLGGDALTGVHFIQEESATLQNAKKVFAVKQKKSKSYNLTKEFYDPIKDLDLIKPIKNLNLTYDEQLAIPIIVNCYEEPIIISKKDKHVTPFLEENWLNFILNVPRKYRYNQYLYKEILKKAYPDLFALPTKTNLGLTLETPIWRYNFNKLKGRAHSVLKRYFPIGNWGVHPMINYIDFDRGLRERDDLKTVVYDNIHDLKKRKIVDWINIDDIWNRHQSKKANHSDALILLASLEINLKAEEIKK